LSRVCCRVDREAAVRVPCPPPRSRQAPPRQLPGHRSRQATALSLPRRFDHAGSPVWLSAAAQPVLAQPAGPVAEQLPVPGGGDLAGVPALDRGHHAVSHRRRETHRLWFGSQPALGSHVLDDQGDEYERPPRTVGLLASGTQRGPQAPAIGQAHGHLGRGQLHGPRTGPSCSLHDRPMEPLVPWAGRRWRRGIAWLSCGRLQCRSGCRGRSGRHSRPLPCTGRQGSSCRCCRWSRR
jgi:hypothetical protein